MIVRQRTVRQAPNYLVNNRHHRCTRSCFINRRNWSIPRVAMHNQRMSIAARSVEMFAAILRARCIRRPELLRENSETIYGHLTPTEIPERRTERTFHLSSINPFFRFTVSLSWKKLISINNANFSRNSCFYGFHCEYEIPIFNNVINKFFYYSSL